MLSSHQRRGSTFSVIFILGCGLLVAVVALSEAGRIERNSTTETFRRVTRDRKRYCGKALTDTLALVCTSYPSPWRKKSASSASVEDLYEGSYREQLIAEIKQDVDELEQLAPQMFDDKPFQFHPFYPHSSRASADAMNPHRRVRRQIVDECCRKSCTMNTLKQYCAD